jgi:hypothetical protein
VPWKLVRIIGGMLRRATHAAFGGLDAQDILALAPTPE